MTTAIIAGLLFVAVVACFVRLIRRELAQPDPYDYCDACASEPMPIEHPHLQPWKPFGEQQ